MYEFFQAARPSIHPSYLVTTSNSLTLLPRSENRNRGLSDASAPASNTSIVNSANLSALLVSMRGFTAAFASASRTCLYELRIKNFVVPHKISGLTYPLQFTSSFRGTPAATSPMKRTRKLLNSSSLRFSKSLAHS